MWEAIEENARAEKSAFQTGQFIGFLYSALAIRNDLATTLALAGQGSLEIIMKDTATIQNEPWRISRWIQIALEEVQKYADSK